MKKLTVIDFFCGAGGFSEGFRQMGFAIEYGYDHWQPAVDTYNHNFNLECKSQNILEFHDSIEKINELPDTTVILGSPPCVSFSNSNKSGKADKYQGLKLIKSFLRIVAVKKHQRNSVLEGWFMENVANSKKHLNKSYSFYDLDLQEWALKQGLNPLGVALDMGNNTFIINSADYGSYQSRKRAISGEIISKCKFIVPSQFHSEKGDKHPKWPSLGDLISLLPSPIEPRSNRILTDPLYPSVKLPLNELTDHFYDTGLYECEWRQSKELKTNHYCMGKMAFPENFNKPSRTITATKCGTSREGLIYKSEYNREGNGEYRSPTIREIASIMGFSITYQFIGNLYTKWRLVGNAVCPSVSRVLAKEVLQSIGYPVPKELILEKIVRFNNVTNLNTFTCAEFNSPPKRTKNSKFRRHPLKEGNLTVTLSNFDIKSKEQKDGAWQTSVQYGTGENFKHQIIEDGFYQKIESMIISLEKEGVRFLKIINNGFTDKIGDAQHLQSMYEKQASDENKIEPTYLIEDLAEIINSISFDNTEFIQEKHNMIFKYKQKVPMRQLFALYGISKISSTANGNIKLSSL